MDADKILKNGKLSAKSKLALCGLVFMSIGTVQFAVMFVLFTHYTPKHHCKIPELNATNLTNNSWLDKENVSSLFIPKVWKDGRSVPSSCTMYNYTIDVHNSSALHNPQLDDISIYNNTVPCQEIYFETMNDGGPTYISEMGLVCDKAWIKPLLVSLMMVGKCIGIPTTGAISDKFGRRPALLLSGFTLTGALIGVATSTTIYTYAIFIAFVGASAMSINTVLFIFVSEMVVPEMRPQLALLFGFAYDIGYVILAVIGYFSISWRWLVGTIAFISSSVCVVYCFLPETVHWLISKGKYTKARNLIFRLNGMHQDSDVNFENEDFTKVSDNDPMESFENRETLWSLVKVPVMRRRLLVCSFNWFTTGFVYFAISLNANLLTGSRYVICALTAVIEFIPVAIAYMLLDRIGRPKTTSICFGISGLVCMTVPLFKMWSGYAVTALAVSSQGLMNGCFTMIYLHTTEIAPTNSRNLFFGFCSSCARIGSILSPYVMFLGEKCVDSYVPYLIMGGFAIVAAILNIAYLPETMKMPLPSNIKEAKEQKTILQMWRKRRKGMNNSTTDRSCDQDLNT